MLILRKFILNIKKNLIWRKKIKNWRIKIQGKGRLFKMGKLMCMKWREYLLISCQNIGMIYEICLMMILRKCSSNFRAKASLQGIKWKEVWAVSIVSQFIQTMLHNLWCQLIQWATVWWGKYQICPKWCQWDKMKKKVFMKLKWVIYNQVSME